MSCEMENASNYKAGEGFEIYRTQTPYFSDLYTDYSKTDFDTILMEDSPILRYKDLLSYDTANHKLTLSISHDSIKFENLSVYGTMFIVTMDKTPVYCGFYWPVISSVPCNWVYIQEPYYELDNLEDNEIVISFSSLQHNDPRLDDVIVERLKKDNKIANAHADKTIE